MARFVHSLPLTRGNEGVGDSSTPWQTQFYHPDARGNVSALTDADGKLLETYAYSAFGEPFLWDVAQQKWKSLASFPMTRGTEGVGVSANTLLYGARPYDADTGLYHQRARAYSPRLGRFLQQDPLGYADGSNPYQYAQGSPYAYNDPTGMMAPLVAGLWLLGAWMFGTSSSSAIEANWEHQAYESSGLAGSNADLDAVSRRNWGTAGAAVSVLGVVGTVAKVVGISGRALSYAHGLELWTGRAMFAAGAWGMPNQAAAFAGDPSVVGGTMLAVNATLMALGAGRMARSAAGWKWRPFQEKVLRQNGARSTGVELPSHTPGVSKRMADGINNTHYIEAKGGTKAPIDLTQLKDYLINADKNKMRVKYVFENKSRLDNNVGRMREYMNDWLTPRQQKLLDVEYFEGGVTKTFQGF